MMNQRPFTHCLFILLSTVLLLGSCQRNSDEVWDDTRTAGRHFGNSVRALGGKHGDSRQVKSQSEFAATQRASDFIPLQDDDASSHLGMSDGGLIPQSSESPGEPGSAVPGIDGFTRAEDDPALRGVFQTIYFPYDSDLIKGRENLDHLNAIIAYLTEHPNTYLFIEGHCDERGTAAYNLALGSRRSNSVRSILARGGANPEQLFTVSYGKEKPATVGHDEGAWKLNRRAEFRIFRRS